MITISVYTYLVQEDYAEKQQFVFLKLVQH